MRIVLALLFAVLAVVAAQAAPSWTFRQSFRTPMTSSGLGQGDLLGTAEQELLVVVGREARILDAAGKLVGRLKLPGAVEVLEVGRGPGGSRVVLGYENWGDKVWVMDPKGKVLWRYEGASGVDGAHWGDLDGDGVDEMVIGFNGGGGLHAVDSGGRRIWSDETLCNVWNQGIIPALRGEPARIYATHAGGQVYRVSPDGQRKTVVSPRGTYCSTMTARRLRPGKAQVVTEGGGEMLGLGEGGRILWRSKPQGDLNWRRPHITSGDLDGDGTDEWVFPEDENGRLVVVSQKGERLGTLEARHYPAILRRTNGPETLVVVGKDAVVGYRLAPARR